MRAERAVRVERVDRAERVGARAALTRRAGAAGGVLAGALVVLALGGCSAQAPQPRPNAPHTSSPSPAATVSPAAAPTTAAATTPARPRTPASAAAATHPARTATAGHCTTGCSGAHHAPTAADGLREDPGPRPTGQATGPGTHPEPGTYVPGQDGPSDTAPVILPGSPPAQPAPPTP